MTSIFLVRTGRTALSAEGRLQGHADRPLIQEGVLDAERAVRRLVGRKIAAIYASPLVRAQETAQIFARALGCHRSTLDGLVDVDVGSWIARDASEIAESAPRAYQWYLRFPTASWFPGGGSTAEVQRRVFDALDTVAARHPGEATVVVTHELPIRLVLVRLRGLDGTAMWDPRVPPGSVTELRATDEGLELPTILEDLFRAADRRRGAGSASDHH